MKINNKENVFVGVLFFVLFLQILIVYFNSDIENFSSLLSRKDMNLKTCKTCPTDFACKKDKNSTMKLCLRRKN